MEGEHEWKEERCILFGTNSRVRGSRKRRRGEQSTWSPQEVEAGEEDAALGSWYR